VTYFAVGDFVFGCDVVDLSNGSFVKDGIERVHDVSGVQVASRRGAIAMQ
jgi:hypothetical protein